MLYLNYRFKNAAKYIGNEQGKNTCASVIAFLGGSEHLALVKQYLKTLEKCLGEKTTSLVVLVFKGHKRDLETDTICYHQLSSVSLLLLYTLDCCWFLKVTLKWRPILEKNIQIIQSFKQITGPSLEWMVLTESRYAIRRELIKISNGQMTQFRKMIQHVLP